MRLPTGTGAGAALVVNAEARSGAEAFEQARHVLEGAGIALGMCVALTDPRQLGETVHAALDAGHSPIIIGGGDGSISAAADVLARHRAVLGILPLGTANDFAHTLGIPCDLEAACAVIAHGEVVEVDLGCVGEVHYLNQASMGLVGKVTEVLPHWLKRLSGPLAYPISTAVAFTRFEPFDAVLRFPAGEHRPVRLRRLLQLGVGNGHYYGGGRGDRAGGLPRRRSARHLCHPPGTLARAAVGRRCAAHRRVCPAARGALLPRHRGGGGDR